MGRQLKYKPSWLPKMRQLAEKGFIDKDIARHFGISPVVLSRYKRQFPEIREVIEEGGRVANKAVESALYRRALGFEMEETTTEVVETPSGTRKHTKTVKKLIPPDTKACEIWLMNRERDRWRNARSIALTGQVDVNHRVGVMVVPMASSVDDWEKAAVEPQAALMEDAIDV